MSISPATRALDQAGVPYVLRHYEHHADGLPYGEEAVRETGLPAEIVVKSLVVAAGPALVFALVPVSARLNLKALARAVGQKKARLAEPTDAERATGYIMGGITPLGSRTPLDVVIDDSVRGRESVVVSAGRRGMNVELSPTDLAQLTGARFAPITG
ncbi:MAG: aminoacyl-tRNA deacylase [Bowdeniella nasicola]|nr:aminoacyl-tRNA deacylase [Bowdeniella nasicola]